MKSQFAYDDLSNIGEQKIKDLNHKDKFLLLTNLSGESAKIRKIDDNEYVVHITSGTPPKCKYSKQEVCEIINKRLECAELTTSLVVGEADDTAIHYYTEIKDITAFKDTFNIEMRFKDFNNLKALRIDDFWKVVSSISGLLSNIDQIKETPQYIPYCPNDGGRIPLYLNFCPCCGLYFKKEHYERYRIYEQERQQQNK